VQHACLTTAVFLRRSVLLVAYLSIKPCWQHSRHWCPQVVAWQWSSTAADSCSSTSRSVRAADVSEVGSQSSTDLPPGKYISLE